MKKAIIIFGIIVLTFVNFFAQEVLEKNFIKVASNQQFPEGPAWDGKNSLFTSNCYGNWISRITETSLDTFVIKPTRPFNFGKTNGMTFDKFGNLIACDYSEGKIIKFFTNGNCTVLADGFEGGKFNRPNDLAFDEYGNLFFTDPKSYEKNILDGRIFMLGKNGEIKLLWDSLAFPNGIAISNDGKELFICESAKNRILKFKLTKDRNILNPTVFAELPGGDPDGLAFDIEGNLYVAHFGGQAIFVISPTGKMLYKIPTPGKKPSNVEFGGKDMKTLFITEDETNCIYKTKMEIAGQKLFFQK